MNKRTVVANLLTIAEHLQGQGKTADAKLLDAVADRVAQSHFDEQNPDFMAEMHGYGGEDEFNGQDDLMDASHADAGGMGAGPMMGGEQDGMGDEQDGMGGDDSENRLMELASKPHLTPEEDAEYNGLLDQLYGGSEGGGEDAGGGDLAHHLSEGGAELGGSPHGGGHGGGHGGW